MVTSTSEVLHLQLLIPLASGISNCKCRTSDVDVTTGCYQGDYCSWDNVELWTDVTIACCYGDYSSCDNIIPTSLFIWKNYFSLMNKIFLRSHVFASRKWCENN